MTSDVIPFPVIAWCRHCGTQTAYADRHTHRDQCGVLASKRKHPAYRGIDPDGDGAA